MNKEKILENEIEIVANNMEVETTKKEIAATKEILAYKEKELNEILQILLERGYTADEIEELTK